MNQSNKSGDKMVNWEEECSNYGIQPGELYDPSEMLVDLDRLVDDGDIPIPTGIFLHYILIYLNCICPWSE